MKNFVVICLVAVSCLSGRTAAAVVADAAPPKDLGQLYAFARQVSIAAGDCEKTWQVISDFQAECRVSLWLDDNQQISFDSQQLIAIWTYADADFKTSITFNRERQGYSVKMNTNLMKFKDRLQMKVARKYIMSAIKDKAVARFQALLARPSSHVRTGPVFSEKYLGPLQVQERTVSFARGQVLAESCRKSWDGFKCAGNLLQNVRGETLLSATAPMVLRSGSLTLHIKSYRGWQNGTAYSALNYTIRTNRFQPDLNVLQTEYDGLVGQLKTLKYLVTQVAGDNQVSPVYTQKLQGPLKVVSWSVPMSADQCRNNVVFMNGQYKSRCEVKLSLPGAIAQPASVYSQYLVVNKLGSYVQVSLTPTGWQAEFTGDQNSVGTYQAVQGHLASALHAITANPPHLFLSYQ